MPVYRPEILDALARHGLRPAPDTRPDVLRDAVRDLYRYEIRRLRDACRGGAFPVRELSARVIALRRRYLLLSTPLARWTVAQDPDPPA
jgi:hypothetical protein